MSTTDENPAAALGRLRWAGVSAEDRSAAARKASAARQAKLSPARRRAIAKKASLAAAKARKNAAIAKKSSEPKSNGSKGKRGRPKK